VAGTGAGAVRHWVDMHLTRQGTQGCGSGAGCSLRPSCMLARWAPKLPGRGVREGGRTTASSDTMAAEPVSTDRQSVPIIATDLKRFGPLIKRSKSLSPISPSCAPLCPALTLRNTARLRFGESAAAVPIFPSFVTNSTNSASVIQLSDPSSRSNIDATCGVRTAVQELSSARGRRFGPSWLCGTYVKARVQLPAHFALEALPAKRNVIDQVLLLL
jgi:hypothetical protein